MKTTTHPFHHDAGLIIIASIKLLYGVLLLVAGIGALSLIHRDPVAIINHWADVLQISDENQLLQKLLENAGLVHTNHLAWVSVITFAYSAMSLAMGFGLLMEKHWAEYLTAIVSASFIPFEAYELVRHYRLATLLVLSFNIVCVIYLVWKLIQTAPKSRGQYPR